MEYENLEAYGGCGFDVSFCASIRHGSDATKGVGDSTSLEYSHLIRNTSSGYCGSTQKEMVEFYLSGVGLLNTGNAYFRYTRLCPFAKVKG